MPLTRPLRESVKERIGDGRSVLRDYINATIGFARPAEETGIPVKSLMRMFGPSGNPNARNLFAAIHALQHASGTSLKVLAGGKRAKAKARTLPRGLRQAS
jgi:hypothetical protein